MLDYRSLDRIYVYKTSIIIFSFDKPLVIFLIFQFRRKHNGAYILCLSLFSLYLLKALDVVFFPLEINGSYVDMMRTVPISSSINLIPFFIGQNHVWSDRDFIDFAKNVLLTIPFGFGIMFISRTRPKDFLWLPFAVGFGVETIQLIISLILNYPYRVVDIKDALLNAAGVFIGYGLFRLFAYGFAQVAPRIKDFPGGLSVYIQEVASR